MPYPVKIGVDVDGRALIGHTAVEGSLEAGTLADRDIVYGSQLPHRVRVQTAMDGWIITTPTHAAKLEAEGTAKKISGGW